MAREENGKDHQGVSEVSDTILGKTLSSIPKNRVWVSSSAVNFERKTSAILSTFISESVKETRMQFTQIHFSPATFDELVLDVRVTIGRYLHMLKH